MEETKICIYCKKDMKYETRKQILCKSIIIEGVKKMKSVEYIVYCWSCKMEDDYCDIVLDEKDLYKNKNNLEKAQQELRDKLYEEIIPF